MSPRVMSNPMKRCALFLLLAVIGENTSFSQQVRPTFTDVAYDDDHPAQCVDVYLTESDKPTPAIVFIHGGGWRGGSKRGVPPWVLRLVAEKKASAISVEYRFTDVAPHPAQVNDCLRAIQFVRFNAREWNIDTSRIGVTGGSAGGHLTAYVTLHDDVAQPTSDDQVQRQSSRVTCGISFAGPTDWSLLKTIDHKHPAYRQLIGYEPGTPADQMDPKQMVDVSPITFADAFDPPLMQIHGDADDIVPIEHAQNLHKKLSNLKATSELVVIPGANHGVAGAGDAVSTRAVEFVQMYLLTP